VQIVLSELPALIIVSARLYPFALSEVSPALGVAR
jgi:hypothetical protein